MKTRSALRRMGLVGILLSKAEAATTTGASSTPNWARVYSADLRGAAAASTAETVVGEAAPPGSAAAVRAASAAAAEAAVNDDPFRRLPGLEVELFYEGVKGDQPIADATHTTAGIFEMVEVSSGGDTYPATGGRLDIAVTDDLRTLDDGSQVEVDNGADNEKAGLPWLPLPFLADTDSSHPGNSAVADPVGYKVAYLATIMLAVSGIAFFGGRGLGLLYVAVLSLPMTSATPTGKDGCGGGDATDNVTWKLFDWFCRIVLAVGTLRTLLKFFKDLWATRLEQRAAQEAALAEAEAGGHRVEEGGGGGGAPGAPAPLPADAPRASWFDTFATVCNGINAALGPRR